MTNRSVLDELYDDCYRVLNEFESKSDQPSVRIGGGNLLELVAWNIIIAFIVRVGSSVASNVLWEKLKAKKTHMLDEKELDEQKPLVEQTINEIGKDTSAIEVVDGKEAVLFVLHGVGLPERLAGQVSIKVVEAITDRLEQDPK